MGFLTISLSHFKHKRSRQSELRRGLCFVSRLKPGPVLPKRIPVLPRPKWVSDSRSPKGTAGNMGLQRTLLSFPLLKRIHRHQPGRTHRALRPVGAGPSGRRAARTPREGPSAGQPPPGLRARGEGAAAAFPSLIAERKSEEQGARQSPPLSLPPPQRPVPRESP